MIFYFTNFFQRLHDDLKRQTALVLVPLQMKLFKPS